MNDPRTPHIPQYPQYPPQDAPVSPVPPVPPPYPAPINTSPYPAPGDPDYDERYKRAKRRVAEIRVFYRSLASYVGVIALLFVASRLTGGGWWFVWVMPFWGFSVAAQGWKLFGPNHFLSKDWEERKIQEEMRRRP